MHGSCPFFGGRSTFWSAWCPRPIGKDFDLMRDFPESMKAKARDEMFWKRCEDLLHVKAANEIRDPCFGQELQKSIQRRLDEALGAHQIPSAEQTFHAPLAVGRKTSMLNTVAFDKFSTPGPLLKIYERQRQLAKQQQGHPLMIATNTVVERFELDPPQEEQPPSLQDKPRRPIVLHTSRGTLCFPKKSTNIILAAGVFPATTILMNSTGDLLKNRAGSRVSGHYISHVAARFPLECLDNIKCLPHLEIGANYLAGKDANGLQYHVQITAIHSPHPEDDAEDAARLCPDYAAAATAEQLRGSEGHVVLGTMALRCELSPTNCPAVCATLGELDEENVDSWVRHEPKYPDVTTNIRLQVLPNEKTGLCRETMEEATYVDFFLFRPRASVNVGTQVPGNRSHGRRYARREQPDRVLARCRRHRAPKRQRKHRELQARRAGLEERSPADAQDPRTWHRPRYIDTVHERRPQGRPARVRRLPVPPTWMRERLRDGRCAVPDGRLVEL
jgi:hypothetical protein